MTLNEIKTAVGEGKTVCWQNDGYVVEKDTEEYCSIHCLSNDNYMGLTWLDNVTMNGEPEEFYIKQ